MKKIRTILAYYNGEKFIDEQLQSIVDQEIPEGYEHEIYVYDDGSTSGSAEYLHRNWGDLVKIIRNKNGGVFRTFLFGLADAVEADVDICFFADQDDIYLQHKYEKHIIEHQKGFGIVQSNSWRWHFEKSVEMYPGRLNARQGHRMSVAIKDLKFNWNLRKFRNEIERIANTEYAKRYHDILIGLLFSICTKVGFVDECLTKYRKYDNSVTSKLFEVGVPKVWKDNYGYYFDVMKPLFKEVFNHNLKIKEFNKGHIPFDFNFLKKKHSSIARYHWNNLSMHLRLKWFRNN